MTRKENPAPRGNAETGPIRKLDKVTLEHRPSIGKPIRRPFGLRGGSPCRRCLRASWPRWRAWEGLSMNGPIDFGAINRAALAAFPAVLARILPGGKRVGAEIVALNPRRADRRLGSFKVNRYNGRWADFATGDKGGDVVSLVAYLEGVSQGEAARRLARMLGLEIGGRRHG